MLFVLGTCFLIIAATGPQLGTKLTELKREGVDLIFTLDVSTSMDAVDVKPSRLEKAKYELGWEPKVSLEDGLARTVSAIRQSFA